jgi:tetratricopeptide (TPR) repeat protein
MLIGALALVAFMLVVALVAWRSSDRTNNTASSVAGEGEESVGRTLSSADITPRAAPAANAEPRSAAEFYERGAYYFSSRNYDAAIRDYRRAIELQPDFANAHNRLGRALMMKGQLGQAADEFREAVRKKNGDYPSASYNLGFALQLQGNADEAVKAYSEAIERRGGNYPDAYFQIGIIQLRRGRDAEAADAMRRAIEQNKGRDPDAQSALGVALAKQRDYAGAETALRAAIEQRGGDFADAHFNLGLVYDKMGRIPDAIREFESYLRQQPAGENRRLAENSIRDLRRRAAREESKQQ